MCKDWPLFLQFLHEQMDCHVRPASPSLGFSVYYADFSRWKLRFSNLTPLVWIPAVDQAQATPRELVQSLQDIARERGWTHTSPFVLTEGDAAPVSQAAQNLFYSFVLLGAAEQERVMKSRRPGGELLDLVTRQISISALDPYETQSPVTGSRFFGRDYEKKRILENPDTNYAVLGVRRIGKTSLLRETERLLKEREKKADETPHIVYMDCSDLSQASDFIREVVRKLHPADLPRLELQQRVYFYFPNFLERMRQKYKRKIVFILDEIDNLVISQRGDWELFRSLRASSNKGICQYIIAGFREAMFEQTDINSPFYNFASELRLSEFTRQQAQDLIVTPMENLGVGFKNRDEVVGIIYEETSGHPNLIQYYCKILLRRLDDAGERELSANNLVDVYADEGFRRILVSSFQQNTANVEKALVYAIILSWQSRSQTVFTQEHMDNALKKQGLRLSQKVIEEACSALKLAGVLQQKGQEYSFTSRVFVKMLQGSSNLVYLMRKVKEEGL